MTAVTESEARKTTSQQARANATSNLKESEDYLGYLNMFACQQSHGILWTSCKTTWCAGGDNHSFLLCTSLSLSYFTETRTYGVFIKIKMVFMVHLTTVASSGSVGDGPCAEA